MGEAEVGGGFVLLERIEFLSGCWRWLYLEIRNTIKHRAHKLAYQKVAERMLEQEDDFLITGSDRTLLKAILDNIHYQGWQSGSVVNLWTMISHDSFRLQDSSKMHRLHIHSAHSSLDSQTRIPEDES